MKCQGDREVDRKPEEEQGSACDDRKMLLSLEQDGNQEGGSTKL